MEPRGVQRKSCNADTIALPSNALTCLSNPTRAVPRRSRVSVCRSAGRPSAVGWTLGWVVVLQPLVSGHLLDGGGSTIPCWIPNQPRGLRPLSKGSYQQSRQRYDTLRTLAFAVSRTGDDNGEPMRPITIVNMTRNAPEQQGIDPLLARLLLEPRVPSLVPNSHNGTIRQEDDESLNVPFGSVREISRGLYVWRTVLVRGRLPISTDFDTGSADVLVWPPQPLFDRLVQTLASLGGGSVLPRLVQRHPTLLDVVLRAILRLAVHFSPTTMPDRDNQLEEYDTDSELYDKDEDVAAFGSDANVEQEPLSSDQWVDLADRLVTELAQGLGGLVSGLAAVDSIFAGYSRPNPAVSLYGIGVQDGLWQHDGWQPIAALQRHVASIPALRLLLHQLGRRSTTLHRNAVHKFVPRRAHASGAAGAQVDTMARESVSGLTHSNSLTDMVPSEAMLLLGKEKAASSLRRLFWAKRVESKLLCYQLTGYNDVASIPQHQNRKLRTPSAPSGPMVICLDTSDSMSGRKMFLSKAVVLASVKAAHEQGRTCRVVAFSTERSVLDAGALTPDRAGVTRLLDFLAHSFAGGGTDVTGALRYAMTLLSSGNDTEDASLDLAGADLLLITDGEIPLPTQTVLDQLNHLEQSTGMEVHGLLVGEANEGSPSKMAALAKLCTHTHDFLLDSSLSKSSDGASNTHRPRQRSTQLSAKWTTPSLRNQRMGWSFHRPDTRPASFLRARKYGDDDNDLPNTRRRDGRQLSSLVEDDNDTRFDKTTRKRSANKMSNDDSPPETDRFTAQVESALDAIRDDVDSGLERDVWKVEMLVQETDADGSCLRFQEQLCTGIALVNENLVEREEESRLLVLGMAAGEHVLLLGPPGTGKSELGRRLSKICGGAFFQRLLTRFTTPEEIFGPLSLRALENDEYKRCTDGFLPKASVAFLDEIFKANSAILNTLLTILNERQFDNGSGLRENCPIRCVIAASNELPESDELDALYDRFLLRKEVLPVSDDGVIQLLKLATPGSSQCNDTAGCDFVFAEGLDKVVEALSAAADNAIHIETDICCLLRDLRSFARDELDLDISDRRLVKAARLLKICAASHGRNQVDPIDCLLLQHVAWNLPEHRIAIKEWLWDNLTPGAMVGGGSTVTQLNLLVNGLRQEAIVLVRKTSGDVSGAGGARELEVNAIASIQTEALALASLLQVEWDKLSRHAELLRRLNNHLWLDPKEAPATQQVLIPKATAATSATKLVLAHARLLEQVLRDDAVSNELRLSVLEQLWNDSDAVGDMAFTLDELGMGMKDAKAKYDSETFRRWKRERKKAGL